MDYSENGRRNGKRHWNNNNKKSYNDDRRNGEKRDSSFHHDKRKFASDIPGSLPYQVQEEILKDQQHIRELKQKQYTCCKCGKPITDIISALADKKTDEPIHFDCVLEILNTEEKLQTNEKITYIGQGRFAVVYFPNIHDSRNFNIVRVIEWEAKDKKYSWRTELSEAFSQVH